MENQQSIEGVVTSDADDPNPVNRSADSIPTDELTDLYNSTDNEKQKETVNIEKKESISQSLPQIKSGQPSIINQTEDLNTKTELQKLKELVEQQRKQLDKFTQDSQNYQTKIDRLTNVIANQSDEIQVLRKQIAHRQSQEGLSNLMTSSIQSQSKLRKGDSTSSLNDRRSLNNLQGARNSTDFWKENDQEFYSTKNAYQSQALQILEQSKKGMKLEDVRQDLWVSKENESQIDIGNQSMSKVQSLVLSKDLSSSNLNKKKEKLKSNTLKKAEKKIFNEDLAEIGEKNPLSSELQETSEKQSSQITPALGLKKKAEDLRSKSLKRPGNVPSFDKIDALKFKMSLQLRNLKMVKEHDQFMRDLEKKQVTGQKRENKIQNIHNQNRLEKDLDRTAKQLRQELDKMLSHGNQIYDHELIQDCDNLFQAADDYFAKQEQDRIERMLRKDYKKIHSRVDTNLKGLKHQPYRVGLQNQQYMEQYDQQDEMVQQMGRGEIQGDVGSSNYNHSQRQQPNIRLPDIKSKKRL